MAFQYYIDPPLRTAFVRQTGRVDGNDFSAAAVALYSDPEMAFDFDVFWDLTDISLLDLMPEDIDAIVRQKKERDATAAAGAGGRVVVIADRWVVLMAAQIVSLRGNTEVRPTKVVETEAEACAWLSLPVGAPDWNRLKR